MDQGLRTLLARVVDYEGLLPPAGLSLDGAVRAYAEHRSEPESWMLARFVCPAGRLRELDPYVSDLFAEGTPLLIAALGAGGGSAEALGAAVEADAAELARVAAAHPLRAAVDQYEVRLPADALADRAAVAALAAASGERLAATGRGHLLLAFEAPVAGTPTSPVPAAAAGIAAANAARRPHARWTGCLKVRCGGLGAASPTAAELATVLVAARDAGVLLKATQGLHHPFTRRDSATGACTHGFVNLLAAAALARARGLGAGELAAALAETDPGAFVFGGEGLRWRGHTVGADDLAAARRFAFASFGSSTFTGPRDGLRAAGLLE